MASDLPEQLGRQVVLGVAVVQVLRFPIQHLHLRSMVSFGGRAILARFGFTTLIQIHRNGLSRLRAAV